VEGGEEVKFYCLEGDSFSYFCLLAPLDSASDPLGLTEAESVNTADTDTPSLSLHDIDGLRVRNSRHSMSSEMLCVRKICS